MPAPDATPTTIRTTAGELALHEYHLELAGRAWTVLHTGAVLSVDDEQRFLREQRERMPYGVVLWPAAIALAHDVASRAGALDGARVLELGAGTGLPGLVAASLGAVVVQTDRHELALSVGARNRERNGGRTAEYRLADWTAWDDDARYDLILGSDILYGAATHPHLRAIFDRNLAPGGRVLLSDPFRAPSIALLEAMESAGWSVTLSRWTVGVDGAPRPVGVYELAPPATR